MSQDRNNIRSNERRALLKSKEAVKAPGPRAGSQNGVCYSHVEVLVPQGDDSRRQRLWGMIKVTSGHGVHP